MSSENLSPDVWSPGDSGAPSSAASAFNSDKYRSDSDQDPVDGDLSQAINALYFIQHQLLELAKDCDFVLTNDMVSGPFFMELQDKLEKLLHETRATWNPPPRPPDLTDFDVQNTIGGGSFGTVKVVTHTETGQAFAMKTIRRQRLTREMDVQHVLLERDILTFTDNPFVVSLFCTFETDTDLCFVMEYLAGGNCENLLHQGKALPVPVARFYTAELVLALEYLHSFGILHGDLKPENLLLTYTGHIKVADFGLSRMGPVKFTAVMKDEHLSKIMEEFTDGLIVGTPRYMAPEMILGMSYGKPVDWWAVGIILYQFLVGSCPYQGTRFKDILKQVITKKLIWHQKTHLVPGDAKDLISTLLSIDVVQRLGTRGAIELKIHPFFQEVQWYSLLDQDPVLDLHEEANWLANAHDENPGESSSESCEEEQPEEPAGEHIASDHDNSTDEEDSADEESAGYGFPFELPYFCSVPFRAKEVYGSPLALSYTLLQHNPVFTHAMHFRKDEEDEEEEEGDEKEEEQEEEEEQEGEEEEFCGEGGSDNSVATLASNGASQISCFSVESVKKGGQTGKYHKKRGRRQKRRRGRRKRGRRRKGEGQRTVAWASAECTRTDWTQHRSLPPHASL